MKILFVTNFYPPYFVGGYELGCRDVVDRLRSRGHEVSVLTSIHGSAGRGADDHVHRNLLLEPFTQGWKPARIAAKPATYSSNARTARRLMEDLAPDVVYQWNPSHVSLAPAFAARDLGIRLHFYVSDHWLSNWERWPHPTLRRWGEGALALVAGTQSVRCLELSRAQFASHHLRDAARRAGRDVGSAAVIPWGVDTETFAFTQRPGLAPRRLLYLGQLGPHKGVHTAIEAFRILVGSCGYSDLTLSIVGGSVFPSYERSLRALASDLPGVRFVGQLPRAEIPAVYGSHDVLVFPSIWEEPFSLALLEAMACGLAVVGTATGGSGEVLRHAHTGLVFEKGDAEACAMQIRELLGDAKLAGALRAAARRRIEESFTLPSMIDRIEGALLVSPAASAGAER